MKPVVHIKELLDNFIDRTPKISKLVVEAGAADLWSKVIDPRWAGQTEALQVQNGTLYVSVSNSVLAQELSLKARDLLSRINEQGGKGEVLKEIRFKAGRARED